MNLNIIKSLAAGAVALTMVIAPAAFAMGHGGHGGGHRSSSHHGGGHSSFKHGGGHHGSSHATSHHTFKHHGGHHTPKHHFHGHGHVTHSYTPVCLKADWVVEHGEHKWACVLWK